MIATRPTASARLAQPGQSAWIALRARRHTALLGMASLAVGLMFGLPHLLIPALLGHERVYTPFAVSGVSALTYDETSSYAAYVNYTLRHAALPYDTDVFENRNVPFPVTAAPYVALAGVAAIVGGVDRAFILADFVIPPIALLILYLLLFDITRRRLPALVGALTVLLVSFGPRNLVSPVLQLMGFQSSGVIQPLEYSRIVHPEVSFTLLAIALLLLWQTMQTRRPAVAVAAGVLGALLFYTYVYYWPVWIGACLVLLLVEPSARRALGLTSAITWLGSIPFWWMLFEASAYPNFENVLTRHTSDLGHVPPPAKIIYSIGCSTLFLMFVALYVRYGSRGRLSRRPVLTFFSAIFIASVAALNMEIITGFNVESMLHFPNRLFQPLLTVAAFALAPWPLLSVKYSRTMLAVAVVLLFSLGVLRQATVSAAVANAHEYTLQDRQLFDWLNADTRSDDVVLATAKRMNDLIPVFTWDHIFVPNGERTSASNQEIGERFLIAMKLLQHSENDVRALLAQDVDHGEPPLGLTYTYFLFLGTDRWRLPDSQIDGMLQDYRLLDVSRELGSRRVDYVYGRDGEQPGAVAGLTFSEVYADGQGELWRVDRVQ